MMQMRLPHAVFGKQVVNMDIMRESNIWTDISLPVSILFSLSVAEQCLSRKISYK